MKLLRRKSRTVQYIFSKQCVFLKDFVDVLKMLCFPYAFGPQTTKTNQKYYVFGHATFEMFGTTEKTRVKTLNFDMGSRFRSNLFVSPGSRGSHQNEPKHAARNYPNTRLE